MIHLFTGPFVKGPTMGLDIALTLVTVEDCEACEMVRELVDELVKQNPKLAIDVTSVDVDHDPAQVIAAGAVSHPTLIMSIDGQERERLTGTMSKRRLLRKLLPLLYPDEKSALAQLRRQLGSPTESFTRIPLRGRVRKGEKVDRLKAVPLFAELSRHHLSQLAGIVDELQREGGEVLTREGEKGDEFFIVVDGSVRIDQRWRKVGTLGGGDCFGEMSLLDGEPRSATVTTTAPTTLLVIHRDDFERMLHTNPPIMRAMLTTLSRRLR
jgi:CRP-like cAMP-binding protein